MRTTPAPRRRDHAAISGSAASAVMSLMIDGPGGQAWRATSALVVSIEIGIVDLIRERLDDGNDPAQLFVEETGSAPGRLDSPPRSSRSAPSAASRAAKATDVSGVDEPCRRRKSCPASG